MSDTISLPSSVVTLADLRRLVSEIEVVDVSLTEEAMRQNIVAHHATPSLTVSKQLSEFIRLNQLDLRDASIRSKTITDVRDLKTKISVVHVIFAASATAEPLEKIVQWLRASFGGPVVVTVGLQPDLIGGAVIRTANRVFDFSVRTQLSKGRQTIVKELEMMNGTK